MWWIQYYSVAKFKIKSLWLGLYVLYTKRYILFYKTNFKEKTKFVINYIVIANLFTFWIAYANLLRNNLCCINALQGVRTTTKTIKINYSLT